MILHHESLPHIDLGVVPRDNQSSTSLPIMAIAHDLPKAMSPSRLVRVELNLHISLKVEVGQLLPVLLPARRQ
jgi:hypothetical protein